MCQNEGEKNGGKMDLVDPSCGKNIDRLEVNTSMHEYIEIFEYSNIRHRILGIHIRINFRIRPIYI